MDKTIYDTALDAVHVTVLGSFVVTDADARYNEFTPKRARKLAKALKQAAKQAKAHV